MTKKNNPVDHGGAFGKENRAIGDGTFTLDADASTPVLDSDIPQTAVVCLFPRNAAAGLLVRTKSVSALVNSAGFTVSVSATGAGAPAGTESFYYVWTDKA